MVKTDAEPQVELTEEAKTRKVWKYVTPRWSAEWEYKE